MRITYRKWSEHPYSGENSLPKGSPEAAYWPMFFIAKTGDNKFSDPFHEPINWKIKNPKDIDWGTELLIVEQTLKSLTAQQVNSARYWATGELSAKISNIIFSLCEKYKFGSPKTSRILSYVHSSINDTFIITWFLKYQWDVARPNQYGKNLPLVLSTPRFPSYPSAHATIAGCSERLLSYFFPKESLNIKKMMEESAQSRLYAGVHFKIDNNEGLRLGSQIGEIVVKLLRAQNQI